MDELKAESICLNDRTLKGCEGLFFSKRENNSVINFQENKLSQDDKMQCSHVNGIIPASTLNILRPVGVVANEFVDRQFVKSLEDFYYHTELHRKRIMLLLDEAFLKYPEVFKGVTKSQMIELLSPHDIEKLLPYSTKPDGVPYYRLLYEHYGKRVPMEIIDNLNAEGMVYYAEAERRTGLMINESMSSALRKEVAQKSITATNVGKILDILDRVLADVSPEEFGRAMYPPKYVEPELRPMVEHLTKVFSDVTKTAEFKTLSSPDRFKYFMKIRAAEVGAYLEGKTTSKVAGNALGEIVARIISSKPVKTGMLLVDGALLAVAPRELGCGQTSEIFTWRKDKDGVCKINAGMNENLQRFLFKRDQNEEGANTKFEILSDQNNCNALLKVKEQQDEKKFKEIKCDKGGVKLKSNDGKNLIDVRTSGGSINEMSFSNISNSNNKDSSGTVTIKYDSELNEKTVCFKVPFKEIKCVDSGKINQLTGYNRNLYRAIANQRQNLAYHIFKSAKSCLDKK